MAKDLDTIAALSLSDAAAQVRDGKLTSVQLVEACLSRIEVYDKKLDAYITVMRREALAQAATLDAERKAGTLRGPLHGVPVALKDNIDTAGTRTTAGSGVYADRVPNTDAPVTTRLKAAGAVILGKTNLHEFAMGAGEASLFGPARNPWALDRNTGGRRPAQVRPYLQTCATARWALIPPARSAILRPIAASSGSNPPSGWCRSVASRH